LYAKNPSIIEQAIASPKAHAPPKAVIQENTSFAKADIVIKPDNAPSTPALICIFL
jgi:hypothetical protein